MTNVLMETTKADLEESTDTDKQLTELQAMASEVVEAYYGGVVGNLTRWHGLGRLFRLLFNEREPKDYNEPYVYRNNSRIEKSQKLLATLINKSQKSIKAISGNPDDKLWSSSYVLDALEGKLSNPLVEAHMIVPEHRLPLKNDRLNNLIQAKKIHLKMLPEISPHFVVVDKCMWRIEEPHPPEKDETEVRAIVDTGTFKGQDMAEVLDYEFDILSAKAKDAPVTS